MAAKLPTFDPNKKYLLRGSTLAALKAAIRACKPKAGPGIILTETETGTIISAVPTIEPTPPTP